MYLPALAQHPHGRVTVIAGRDAATLAQRWDAPHSFARDEDSIHSGLARCRDCRRQPTSHCPLHRSCWTSSARPCAVRKAAGFHLRLRGADGVTRTAAGAICMTPFTYHYMPAARYLKRLLDDGYIGRPFHLNFRYFTGFGREPAATTGASTRTYPAPVRSATSPRTFSSWPSNT